MTAEPAPLRVIELSKSFGAVAALQGVDLTIPLGTFNALLGENGAGKSTLAKCVLGIHKPDSGRIEVDGIERQITSPRAAQRLGIGMVHQHFSLVPNMTVAENLIIADPKTTTVIDWPREFEKLEALCGRMPFRIDLRAVAGSLAAGEKQKVEIVKQLYLGQRLLILDEPTSVLTLAEADELLGMLQEMCAQQQISVLLITHKMREVFRFAEFVTVLRQARLATSGRVNEFSPDDLTHAMIGRRELPKPVPRSAIAVHEPRLEITRLCVRNDENALAVRDFSLSVCSGEVVGIAGISGNGQMELLEALAGQRDIESGSVQVHGEPYRATREQMMRHNVFYLPEEPLRNACVGSMSLAENLAFRNFDQPPIARTSWLLSYGEVKRQATELIKRYGIKAANVEVPLRQLSGGNVQRAVLARELSGRLEVLVASNPCFGLDIGAVAEIHNQILLARNRGAAVLLISEDLDELIALADCIVVMFEGRPTYKTATHQTDAMEIGRYMTGRQSDPQSQAVRHHDS